MDGVNIKEVGAQWHRIIGYVPQSIYMTDSTIRRNIAFGIEESKIDDTKIWKALEMAQLKEFVEKLPKGLETRVGEWGQDKTDCRKGGGVGSGVIAGDCFVEADLRVLFMYGRGGL